MGCECLYVIGEPSFKDTFFFICICIGFWDDYGCVERCVLGLGGGARYEKGFGGSSMMGY